jgi:TPR repeat protein
VSRVPVTALALAAALVGLIGATVWPHRTGAALSPAVDAEDGVGIRLTPLSPEVRRLRVRAEAGDAGAQLALGNAYEAGDGVPRNGARALGWYRRAAGRGHVDAQVSLALLYLDGHHVMRDPAQAVTWLQRAAGAGNAFAQHTLAGLLESGDPPVMPEPVAAARWYRAAAEQGYAPAQLALGRLLEEGRAVMLDVRQAAAWYRRAADQDLVDAQIRLGLLFRRAELGPDLVEAHVWFNLAASRFKSLAQYASAARLRDEVAPLLTEAEQLEAFRRATAWQDTLGMAGR